METKSLVRYPTCFAVVIAVLMLAGSTGCVSGGAGSPVAYLRGDLDATLNVPFESALRATDRAIEQLQFGKVSEKKDALQAVVVSRNATDKRVEIRIEKVSEDATKLRIRVGTFGDEALAMATYTQINANL